MEKVDIYQHSFPMVKNAPNVYSPILLYDWSIWQLLRGT